MRRTRRCMSDGSSMTRGQLRKVAIVLEYMNQQSPSENRYYGQWVFGFRRVKAVLTPFPLRDING
jgi:hypothetical protein